MTELESPAVEKAFADYFRSRPDISPCLANRQLIDRWLAENLKTSTTANIASAVQAVEGSLAKQTPAAIPQGKAPEPAPAAAVEPEPVDLRKLSPAELRKIIQQEDRFAIPKDITSEKIKAMSRTEQNILISRYGSEKVRRRLFQGI